MVKYDLDGENLIYSGYVFYISYCFLTILVMLIPQKLLLFLGNKRLTQFLGDRDLQIKFAASGRSALSLLLGVISNDNKYKKVKTILLPDYICNVVYEAANYNGYKIIQYSTNDYYPCIDEICTYVHNNPYCCVLIASYLGRVNDYTSIINKLHSQEPSTIIIFDECQNFFGSNLVPLSENIYLLLSFNNKMMPGFLGGAVVAAKTDKRAAEIYNTSLPKNIFHEAETFVGFCKQSFGTFFSYGWRKFKHPSIGDYSTCKGKYSVAPAEIMKTSISAFCCSLWRADKYQQNLKDNLVAVKEYLAGQKISILGSPNSKFIIYLPISVDHSKYGLLPLKGEYQLICGQPSKKGCICLIISSSVKYRLWRAAKNVIR